MFPRDRKWSVTLGDFYGEICDYNWEITGYTENMVELGARYSSSMWYLIKKLNGEGFAVEVIDNARNRSDRSSMG